MVLAVRKLLSSERMDGSPGGGEKLQRGDVTEILIHRHAGRSQSEISTSLGVDRKTVKKYLQPALDAGITPGDAPRAAEAWA